MLEIPGSIKAFSRCRGYWSILLSICCMYIYMFGCLCRATYCSVVSTWMLGVSHAFQNDKKLQVTQSDSVYLYLHTMLGVSHAVQNEKKICKLTQSDW